MHPDEIDSANCIADRRPSVMEAATPIRVGLIHSEDIYRAGLCWLIKQEADLALVYAMDHVPSRDSWFPADVVLVSERIAHDTEFISFYRLYIQKSGVRLLVWQSSVSEQGRVICGGAVSLHPSCPGRLVSTYIRLAANGVMTCPPEDLASSRPSPASGNAQDGNARQARSGAESSMQIIGQLGARDRDFLWRIAQGQTNGQMGRDLYLAESTIKKHVHRILSTLGCAHRAQAAAYFARFEVEFQDQFAPLGS